MCRHLLTLAIVAVFSLGLYLPAHASDAVEGDRVAKPITPTVAHEDKPLIQLAILLDTSSSMSGLINQARTQIWSIVNELATTKRDGLAPRLEVALYQYGNSGLSAETGYIQQKLAFTEDLDKVSEALFALTTGGGSEHCGQVIDRAADDLKWDNGKDVYKVVFIAGNEPFTQGPVAYQDAVKNARDLGVLVNTIHCGSERSGISGKWQDGANLGGGVYLNIDQNQKVVHIPSPYDEKLTKLNAELNDTYLWYGAEAKEAAARQEAQDANAAKLGAEADLSRIAAKSTANYHNARADLVDAAREKDFKLEDVEKEALPNELKDLSVDEQKKLIEEKAARRAEIQAKIKELSKKRDMFVAEKRKELAEESGKKTLGEAMLDAVREQATRSGFEKVAE